LTTKRSRGGHLALPLIAGKRTRAGNRRRQRVCCAGLDPLAELGRALLDEAYSFVTPTPETQTKGLELPKGDGNRFTQQGTRGHASLAACLSAPWEDLRARRASKLK